MPPDPSNLTPLAIGFTLTFFRVAGLMLLAPLFGSARVPKRFKTMIALVMAVPMFASLPAAVPVPATLGGLIVGLAGELALGLMLGLTVALVFIAAQWSGEMIGQQIGFNLSEVFDPQFGGGGSLVGDLSFMLSTAIFLIFNGHCQLVQGIHDSLVAVPPLSFGVSEHLLDCVLAFLSAATHLALRLSAPIFVTMIIVDVAIGCISRTMPQLNVMSAGMSVRAVIGMGVLIVGVSVTAKVLATGIHDGIRQFQQFTVEPAASE